jgi:hypothetical protein
MRTRKTGISMGSIIDVGKANREWQRKGKARCTKCIYLEFGYYCRKKKKTPVWVKERRKCKSFRNR